MNCDNSDMYYGARIAVVDDDPGIRELIADFLGRHGFTVLKAKSGEELDSILETDAVDLIVLDIMMPGEDGLSICRRLTAAGGPPIIILSAIGDDTDRIIGLEIGADDYLAKPGNPRELLARVRAVLRRRKDPGEQIDSHNKIIQFAGWQLNLGRHELKNPQGVVVNLSDGEFSLLRIMSERPQRVLSRDQLLEYVKGPDADVFDRSIDVQVSRLRRKLGADEGEDLIRTIRNEGYMFVPKVSRR
ncbi:response regulator [Emcibacter nanhaiensis]|uniref:Regulatory protein VirG n=1 Tax=Emcibacter nanhaiensis TaxID=1505037 RepID=A0A501PJB2_9PROT|nr:response regulator [Emcibacter nanhaiensis]TPD60217.1 response regulator [Emcibacter nanhaiensis]